MLAIPYIYHNNLILYIYIYIYKFTNIVLPQKYVVYCLVNISNRNHYHLIKSLAVLTKLKITKKITSFKKLNFLDRLPGDIDIDI